LASGFNLERQASGSISISFLVHWGAERRNQCRGRWLPVQLPVRPPHQIGRVLLQCVCESEQVRQCRLSQSAFEQRRIRAIDICDFGQRFLHHSMCVPCILQDDGERERDSVTVGGAAGAHRLRFNCVPSRRPMIARKVSAKD
jgi:hypothetical protein